MNERARWYATQIWQIPLAYVAAVALVTNAAGKGDHLVRAAMIFLALIGIGVFCQLIWLYEGNHRAAINIQKIESLLRLERTAEHRPWATVTMIIVVCFIWVALLAGAIWSMGWLSQSGTAS